MKQYWKVLGVSGMNIWNPSPLCKMTKDGKEKAGCSAPDIASNLDIPIKFFSKEADL